MSGLFMRKISSPRSITMPHIFLKIFTLALICMPVSSKADVRFVIDKGATFSGERGSDSFYNINSQKNNPCEEEGYTITSCPTGFIGAYPCPYNSSYFQSCCPDEYIFTAEECTSMGKETGASCGGKYSCE